MPKDLKRHSQNISPSFAEEYIRNVWDSRLRLGGNFWHQIEKYERNRLMNQQKITRILTVPYDEGEEVFVDVMMQLYHQGILLIGNNSFSTLGIDFSEPTNTHTMIKDEESYREIYPLSESWASVLTVMLGLSAPTEGLEIPKNQQNLLSDWTMESALLCLDAESGDVKLLIKINLFWAIELSLPHRKRYGNRIRDISLIFIPTYEETKRWSDIKIECLNTIIGAGWESIANEQIDSLIQDLSSGEYGNEWGGFKYLRTSEHNEYYPIKIKTVPVYGEDGRWSLSYSIIDVIRWRSVNRLIALNYSKRGFNI